MPWPCKKPNNIVFGYNENDLRLMRVLNNLESRLCTWAQEVDGAVHARLHSVTSIADHSSSATPGRILQANANGLPINATNTDVQVSQTVQRLPNAMSTGILRGGRISPNGGDNEKFDIFAGEGVIVDNNTDVDNPTVTYVTWNAMTGVSHLAFPIGASYVFINSAGTVVQQTSYPTPADRRDMIFIGLVGHHFSDVIDYVVDRKCIAYDADASVGDFFCAFGLFNIDGNVFSSNGANLKVDKSAGSTFAPGMGYHDDRESPHVHNDDACAPCDLIYAYQTAPGVFVPVYPVVTDVDPENYDTGAGLAAVAAGKFTIQSIYYLTQVEDIIIQYGQAEYTTLALAEAAITLPIQIATWLSSYQSGATFRGWLIVQQGCVDLSNAAQVMFIPAGRFGMVSSLVGAAAGENNTASNIGTGGVGVFKQKLGVDLQLKKIRAASARITVTDNPGLNTIDLDVPAGSTQREIWFPAETASNRDNFRVRAVAGSGNFNFVFAVPFDFVSLVSCEIIGLNVSVNNATADIDLISEYGAIGEDWQANSESNLASTYNLSTQDRVVAISLASVITGVAAGDYVGINVDHNSIGGTIEYIGIKLKYNTV